jgi:hypothetical protein
MQRKDTKDGYQGRISRKEGRIPRKEGRISRKGPLPFNVCVTAVAKRGMQEGKKMKEDDGRKQGRKEGEKEDEGRRERRKMKKEGEKEDDGR